MTDYDRMRQINLTFYEEALADDLAVETSFLELFVNMSYMYYSVLGSFVCVSVGCIVSLFTYTESYDSKLIHPIFSRFMNSETSISDLDEEKPRHNAFINALAMEKQPSKQGYDNQAYNKTQES